MPVVLPGPRVRPPDSAEKRLRGASAGAHVVLLAPVGPPGAVEDAADVELGRLVAAATRRARESGADGPRTVVRAATTAQALAELADAADRAAHDGCALALLDVDLAVSPVALLDLFDHPGRRTAALVRQGDPGDNNHAAGWPPVRWGEGPRVLVESVGTPQHALRGATGVALGAVRVDRADVAMAARLWRQASGREWAGSASALALLALTRGGVPVSAVPLEQFSARHATGPALGAGTDAGADADADLGADPDVDPDADPWRLRLRSAARPVDGFYSVFVVRKVSRAITWRLLPTGVAPNAVTVVSLLLGLLTAVLCGIGGWLMLVLAAVLLQVSLVLDCVDGEIARYTRRFSPLGAWLDVTGDRLKENGVYAGLALWSFRTGNDLWLWAVLAMGLVAYRHFVDYGFGASQRAALLPAVFVGPLDQPDDGGGPLRRGSASRLSTFVQASDATNTTAWVHWAKKAIHLPIGERYLVVSLGLLTGRPLVVFAALVVLEVLAAGYTTGGRILRSLGSGVPEGVALPPPDPDRPTWGEIDHQLDLGPLARGIGAAAPRGWRTPLAAVAGCAVVLAAAVAVRLGLASGWLVPAMLLLTAGLGLGLAAPVVGRLVWVAPSTLFAAEAAVVLLVQHRLAPAAGGAAFLFVAAAAYRRYDVIYRTRDQGRPPAPWTSWVTLGVEGRLLLVALAALASGGFATVLLVAGALVAVFVLLESTAAWLVWLRSAGSTAT